ncbi:MAG TPA: Dabb family protein [Acidimicrobiia bacterium]|nr:Dabb family protein [Acidimicrobiia bacterium]
MIRHVSVLTFDADIDLDALEAALAQLPGQVPQLRAYAFGRDVGIDTGNGTFAVVADVDDEAAYAAYRDHPAHQRVLAELIRPHLVARAAVQYSL